MNRAPVVHLMLDFNGQSDPAFGTIWDYILADPGVLQHIREATARGTDLLITAVTNSSGMLAKRPYISLRHALPTEFNHYDTYMHAPYTPRGAAEVRVYLTGHPAAQLSSLLERLQKSRPRFRTQSRTG